MHALEEAMHLAIGYLVLLAEACGALVVAVGIVRAALQYLRQPLQQDALYVANMRLQLVQSMVVGLEFQVAADVLKTALSPTLRDLLMLAAIIALRTVLAFLLEREFHTLREACQAKEATHGGPELAERAEE